MNGEIYMRRCIELGLLGVRATKSNPMVGAVLVYYDRIIGEGYHASYGGAHAEVNALASVATKDQCFIKDSTLYVSLEPCCTDGKTPPCTALLLKHGIKKVVVGCLDPNPAMNGKGVAALKQAGVAVVVGLLEEACLDLIRKFEANLQKRPYVILKWACTLDGYMGHIHDKLSISNKYSNVLNHKWRTENDAILVGKTTALRDNPQLNSRLYNGIDPIRVLLDADLSIPIDHHLISDGRKTIVFNKLKTEKSGHTDYHQIADFYNVDEILKVLFVKDVCSIIIEGGSVVLNAFINSNCWHEARIIRSNQKIEHKYQLKDLVKAPEISGQLIQKLNLEGDEVLFMRNVKSWPDRHI